MIITIKAIQKAEDKRSDLIRAGLKVSWGEITMNIILGLIIVFAIGSCTVKDACKPDDNVGRYKFCSKIFDK